MNRIVFLLVFAFCVVYPILSDFEYPSVRRDDTISDDYFGTKVKDPYRWLEDPESDETKMFVSDQNKITREYLDNNKYRDQISQSFKHLYNYPKYEVPIKVGDKYYYSSNTGLQNQNIYYSIESIDSNEPKVFLDPNQLSADGTIALNFMGFSIDGKYCAYGLSEDGSDWTTIKIKNTETLEDFPETLTKIKFTPGSLSWTNDNLGFFYPQFDEYNGNCTGNEPDLSINQKIFYHRINTKQTDDIKISAFPEHPFWLILGIRVSDDGKYINVFIQEGYAGNYWFYAKLESLPVQKPLKLTSFTDLRKKSDSFYFYVTSDDHIVYIRTTRNALNFRLVRVDLNKPQESNWVDILPEDKHSVLKDALVVNKDYLVVIFMRNVFDFIQIHNLIDGKFIRKIDTPMGTVDSTSTEKDGLFYKITSFLLPGTIYRHDFPTNTIKIFKDSKVFCLNANHFVINQKFLVTKDGVRVPLFLVHKKNLKLDSSNPALLYAYGGFGISTQPSYEPLATFFFKNLNGVYALANIRGGGEYGESWHRAGSLTNRQNGYDDFASAAEYLIANKYTQKERLTIHGVSNGGLLIGVSANQRPDLFGCALARVGVMDLLRFPLFTVGYNWRQDYGDPQHNKTEFQYIYRYSPLHSIPEDATQYPPMLILTADHDDRVVPSHSYKFAAQLQYLLGSELKCTPLMIRIDSNSGHGPGKPVYKLIEENTDMISFVLNSLKINYQNSIHKQYPRIK